MAASMTPPDYQLPWHASREEDGRFWRILGWCLVPLAVLSVVIPLLETPELAREERERVPPQLARVLLEEQTLPEPEPEPEPEPAPDKEPAEPAPEPEPPSAQTVEQARERAQQSGVLQFADDLAQMRDSVDVSEVSGAQATPNQGEAEAAEVDRALIASRATTRSGGVDTSNLSRELETAGLSGRETTRVEHRQPRTSNAETAGADDADSDERERTDESIRKVLDRNKSAIFAIYNRALRRDPTLEGRMVVRLVIEPDGRVSAVETISSELNNEELESRILMRIRLIDFGAEQVGTTRLNYTFDFLPS